MKRIITGLLAALTLLVATGCAEAKTTEFSIGYVIRGGVDDSRGISKILMPGVESNRESDDDVIYIYANARNWNVQASEAADVNGVWSAKSRPSGESGEIAGFTVEGQGITPFAVNRPDGTDECTEDSKSEPCRALFGFYQYCEKYDCGNDPDADTEKQNLSTDPGWRSMLYEGWGQALAHAWTTVISGYGPEIANQPEKWDELGAKMGELAFDEMSDIVGLPDGVHIFCDPDVISGEKCHAPKVKIHNIASPEFAALTTSQRDQEAKKASELDRIASEEAVRSAQQALDEAKAADQAKLLNTPGYAESLERQAVLEQIQACAAAPAGTCTIILGASGNTTTQLQVPVK